MSSLSKQWYLSFFLVVLTYFICHFLMFFVGGTGWDDMFYLYNTQEEISKFLGPETFNNPIMLWIFKGINLIEDFSTQTLVYRLCSFIGNFITVTSIWYVVKVITRDFEITLFVSLLAAACSVNKCMILICCYHYTFSNALFFLGLCFFLYDFYNHNRWCLLICAFLWFLSFTLWKSAALLMPLVVIIACINKTDFNYIHKHSYWNLIKCAIVSYWEILFALIVASVIYVLLLSPQGEYADYYKIRLLNVVLSPITCLFSCLNIVASYFGVIVTSFSSRETEIFIGAVLLFVPVYILVKDYTKEDTKISGRLLVIAVLFLYFSVYPQMLKGRLAFVCDIDNYGSKTASLAALPLSLFIVYFISTIQRKRIKNIVFSILFVGSILYSMEVYFDYNKFWSKKISVINYLKEHHELKGKKVLIIDTVTEYDAFPRGTSTYYDYDGCARLAYGKYTKTSFSVFYPKQEREPRGLYDYKLLVIKNADISSFDLMTKRIISPAAYDEAVNDMLIYRLEKTQ